MKFVGPGLAFLILLISGENLRAKPTLLRQNLALTTSVPCRIDGRAFNLETRLAKGGEDTSLWIATKDGASLLIGPEDLPMVPFALFESPISKDAICERALAYRFDDALILPISGNDRPFGRCLNFAILGAKRLDFRQLIQAPNQFPDDEKVQRDGDSLWFFTAAQPSDSDVRSDVLLGKRKADTIEDGVLAIARRLQKENGHWVLKIDPDRTWERFPYKEFFKTKTDFARSFSLEAKPIVWVRVAVKDGKPFCLYPSRDRTLPANESKWICL